MAEKETKNKPKNLVEATPEKMIEEEREEKEVQKLKDFEDGKSVEKIVDEAEKEGETVKQDKDLSPAEKRAEREKQETRDKLAAWVPKTKIGEEVKSGKEKSIDNILENGKKILEQEIVDSLLKLGNDLILMGQAKGKFGGGKRRVWRQTQRKTKEGNILTFSAMAVVGDKNGHVGLGHGRAKETLPAREKAMRIAKLNIMKIDRGCSHFDCSCNEKHTVPYVVEGKCGSVRIKLMPAPQGTGLVVGDECKKILRLAGIKDVYSATKGHVRTTFNLAKACIDALKKTTELEK